ELHLVRPRPDDWISVGRTADPEIVKRPLRDLDHLVEQPLVLGRVVERHEPHVVEAALVTRRRPGTRTAAIEVRVVSVVEALAICREALEIGADLDRGRLISAATL